MAIFASSLILWLAESIPNYLTSFLIIVAAILTGVIKMRQAFAMLGEPVMILNIASFIMASTLVATGLAKRLCIWMILKMGNNVLLLLACFMVLNIILGAFISATSAKTALLLPLFMVLSAMYGSTADANRNNVCRNFVLQNLLTNNVSASAFITGSAANLLAASLLENAGYKVYYGEWLMALLPLCVIQCFVSWYTGTRWIFPISEEDAKPKLAGGIEHLRKELDKLGHITAGELRAGIIFIVVLALWATDRYHGIRSEVVAMCGAIAVLMPSVCKLPRLGVIKWNQADIPWHMLMFSWGAYVLGGIMSQTDIVGLFIHSLLDGWNAASMPKMMVFTILALIFALTTLVSESKTARTIVLFPIMISVAQRFGWNVIGFCLPMAFFDKPDICALLQLQASHHQLSDRSVFKLGIFQVRHCAAAFQRWASRSLDAIRNALNGF